jgi:drug/metabolite transporter (DMT)-like permease
MSGAIWATVASIGFGLFQSINRQAVRGMDVWQSTFMQLAVSAVILLLGALATEDLGELRSVSALALAAFLAAGLVHFLVGWTLLNASQKRIGAARTSPLLAATPLFGAVLAALTLSEVPGLVTIAGMLLILAGVYVTVGTGEPAEAAEQDRPGERFAVPTELTAIRGLSEAAPATPTTRAMWGSSPTSAEAVGGPPAITAAARWRGSLLGLGTAACWSVSPLLSRVGLERLPNPMLGVTISMIGATIPQGIVVALRARRGLSTPVAWDSIWLKLAAGVLVGVSTWTRWEALALAPVAVVLALGLLSVPTVILVAPLLAGRREEQVTHRIVLGAVLVVAGSLVLVVRT